MVRTLVSVAVLFAAVFGGFHLLRESGAGRTTKVARPVVSERDAGAEEGAPVREPQTARVPKANQSSQYLELLETCGDNCCGLDGLPPAGESPPPGHVMPYDHLGRLWVPSDLEGMEIPIPELAERFPGDPLFRLLGAQSEENADDNEPKEELPLEGPTAGEKDAPAKLKLKPTLLTPIAPLDAGKDASGTTPVAEVAPDEKPAPSDETPAEEKPAETTPEKSANAPVEDPTEPPKLAPPVAKPLTPQLVALREKVRTCLSHYYFQRQESTAGRSPWGLMHCLISYGVDTSIIHDNRRVNAIGWLCYNGLGKGQNLFYLDRQGRLEARIGVGVQGHAGQFLAMLAQSRVKSDFPLRVEGKSFTVKDLIEYEQRTCKAGTELTFKLIAFSYYLPSDAKWKSDLGEDWDMSRLIREELKQPIVGAACGGTHRLMGLSYAVKKREQRGEPMDGQWLRAKQFTETYQEYLIRLQNPDGSFSTDWFVGRGDNGKPTRKLETSGHMLEWLIYTLPEERLREPRIIRAVDFLATLMLSDPYGNWNIGPRGHGLHALALYDERVFGGKPGERGTQLAKDFKQLRR